MVKRRLTRRIGLSVIALGFALIILYAFQVSLVSRPDTESLPNQDSNSVSSNAQGLIDETQPHRDKWTAHGSPNYAITIIVSWLPSPTRNRVLVFRNNTFVSQANNPDCEYFCDWSLDSPELYSVDALFDRAQKCINNTIAAYATVSPLSAKDFHGFDSFADLAKFERSTSIPVTLPDLNVLCTVQYDPALGYPREISMLIPGVMDGAGGIEIKKLELLP